MRHPSLSPLFFQAMLLLLIFLGWVAWTLFPDALGFVSKVTAVATVGLGITPLIFFATRLLEPYDYDSCGLAFVFTLAVIYAIYANFAIVPVWSWDGLDYWVIKSSVLFDGSLSKEHVQSGSRHPSFFPFIVYSLRNFFADLWFSQVIVVGLLIVTPFTVVVTAMVSSVISQRPAMLPVFLLFCLPLFQNHAIAVGYVEIWMFSIWAVGLVLIHQGISTNSAACISGGCLLTCVLLAFKASAISFLAATFAALVSFYIIRRNWRATWVLVLALSIFVFTPFVVFGLLEMPLPITLHNGLTYAIRFDADFFTLITYIFHALVINQSFSILAVTFLFLIVWQIKKSIASGSLDDEALVFLALLSVLVIPVLTLELHFVPYLRSFSSPDTDTMLSRLLMVGSCPVLIYFSRSLDILSVSLARSQYRWAPF